MILPPLSDGTPAKVTFVVVVKTRTESIPFLVNGPTTPPGTILRTRLQQSALFSPRGILVTLSRIKVAGKPFGEMTPQSISFIVVVVTAASRAQATVRWNTPLALVRPFKDVRAATIVKVTAGIVRSRNKWAQIAVTKPTRLLS